MENYQRKRLKPLAFLVIGLVLAPLGIVPATQMMQQTVIDSSGMPITSTKTVGPQSDITVPVTTTTAPTTATTVSGTLEGMTLDAQIRPLRPGLLTESLA
ncbi:hypothetical protein [Klebsiella variicola]|uniref:hypothetical protein n=1 Tax=Klebsiella variicola TaxID=244366 RepID=UPI001C260949|nr:hypothetical protein [Klebsiella variicola]